VQSFLQSDILTAFLLQKPSHLPQETATRSAVRSQLASPLQLKPYAICCRPRAILGPTEDQDTLNARTDPAARIRRSLN
jgi:hypothetical protein